MPTNEERREVANNLRGGFDVTKEGRYYHLNGTLFGMGIYASSEQRLRDGLRHLADFIDSEPERTCEWFWLEEWRDDEEGRECDAANWALSCGCWDWSDEELYDFDNIESKPTCWEYCPRCGTKVMQDAD